MCISYLEEKANSSNSLLPCLWVRGSVLPIELEMPFAWMALALGMVLEPRTTSLEALEKQDRAAKVMERYHESIARAYNQTVVPRRFEEGDLAWKIVDPIMRGQPLPKFSPKWEGPYWVIRASVPQARES